MMKTRGWLARLRRHASSAVALRPGDLPLAAMLRSGLSISLGFVALAAIGRIEAAILCAFFTNFLCLADRSSTLTARLRVQVLGGCLFLALGGTGLVLAGHVALVVIVVFVIAAAAGFVHGTAPGLEALPRFGLCCLVVTAFLPIDAWAGLEAGLCATAISIVTVLVDHAARHGRRGAYAAVLKADAARPGPRFSLVYGSAAAIGLLVGIAQGGIRPYWVPLTTLLVMQPDRRANTLRVTQRLLGTIAGVVFAFVTVGSLPEAIRWQGLVVLVLALPFGWPLAFERNYGLGTAVLSAWVLMLIDTALPQADLVDALFRARLADTAMGCAIALAGSLAVWEVREDRTISRP